MFVTAFPLATTMALVNNYVGALRQSSNHTFLPYLLSSMSELRVDAWKLCQLTRRPEPRSQEDIGTWWVEINLASCFLALI